MTGDLDLGIAGLRDVTHLGAGGFGAVYAATDTDLDRRVAVKVLHHLPTGSGPDRFDRERKAMGRLSGHPGIVTLYQSGYTAQGDPYLMMELVEGGSLGDQLKARGRLPWPEAVALVIPVARALGYAHERGVLHRDIKPANILLDQGRPKLADFGIARLSDHSRTASGLPALSLAHAAPETFSDQRDERSDLYSLVSTLHQLIAGRPPFLRGDEDSQLAVLQRILTEAPPRLGPHLVPPALDDLLARGLAKDPAHRPRSAAELVAALEAVQSGATAPLVGFPSAGTPGPLPPTVPTTGWPEAGRPGPVPPLVPTTGWPDDSPGARASGPGGLAGIRWGVLLGAAAAATALGATIMAGVLWLQPDGAASGPDPTNSGTAVGAPVGADATDGTEGTDNTAGTGAGEDSDTAANADPPVALTGHTEVVTSLAWLGPDRLVSSSNDQTVRIWDPAAPEAEPGRYEAHTDVVWSVVALTDGRVASASWDGSVRVWDPDRPGEAGVVLTHPDRVWSVAELPDGRLATGSGGTGDQPDNAIRIWDLDQPDRPDLVLDGARGAVVSLAVTGDGVLAAASLDGAVYLWPITGDDLTPSTYRGHDDAVWEVVALADGRLASASLDDTVQVWDPARPDAPPTATLVHPDDVLTVAALADGRLATGDEDHLVRVWDPARPDRPSASFSGHELQVVAVAGAAADGRIASAGYDLTIRIATY